MSYHIVCVYNPRSSNNKRVIKKLQAIEDSPKYKVDKVLTTKDPAKYEKKLLQVIRPKSKNIQTLLMIGGGDGTVHDITNLVLGLPESDRKHIVLLPIWGGNANDFACMLNGMPHRKSLTQIIEKGRQVKVSPLEVRTNKKDTHYAVCYASFGATAHAAHRIDQTGAARSGWAQYITLIVFFKELFQVIRAFVSSSRFRIKLNGKIKKRYEILCINGSRIAKMNRSPVKLTDGSFYVIMQREKHINMLIRLLTFLVSGRGGRKLKKSLKFTSIDSVYAQYDGEVYKIKEKSEIKVTISKRYITALSTRL